METNESEKSAIIVGVGPGDPDYVHRKGKNQLREADRIAGFEAALKVVGNLIDAEEVTLTYGNQEEQIQNLYETTPPGGRQVVACYGDPHFSDFEFIERWDHAGYRVRVLPGISCVQVACSRAGIPMEHTLFVTFHRRGSLEEDRKRLAQTLSSGARHAVILPHPWDFMPVDVASFLLENGVDSSFDTMVGEHLTLPDETIHRQSLAALAERDEAFSDLSVMVIRATERPIWQTSQTVL